MHATGRHTARILPNTMLVLLLIATCPVFSRELVQEISITLGDYQFTPNSLEVTAGQSVRLTLTNTDRITPHNFIMDNEDAGLNINTNISAGKTAVVEFTPTTPGSYTFYCSKKLPFMKSHQQKGMEGILIVK